jgi:hypothetical protein
MRSSGPFELEPSESESEAEDDEIESSEMTPDSSDSEDSACRLLRIVKEKG